MELKLQNSQQVMIADLLWTAEDMDAVESIIDQFGREAELVYELMVATSLDEVDDFSEAAELIKKVSK